MTARRQRRRLHRCALALATVLVSLVAIEIGLRVAGFEFRLYPTRIEFGYPDPQQIADYYLPHDEYLWVQKDYAQRIARHAADRPYLVLTGCSCTERGGYGEELVRLTGATPGEVPLRIANLAVGGWSSYQGLQQMRDVVALAPKVMTIYFGWNDHWKGFGIEDAVAARINRSLLFRAQGLRVVQLAGAAVVRLQSARGDAPAGRHTERVPLPQFRANLAQMVDIARSHGITPVLITAPTTQRRGAEPEFLRARWMDDLSQLVPLHRSYADGVRAVAAERSVLLFDLARAFDEMPPADAEACMMDDGIHFTESGGKHVGRLLHAFMLEHGLLPKPP